ncbi:hypothetical protein [Thermus tengchongensis]|uniref:hypothetical protein n=1 Tax=Thermus tengchongensis TaxID=1214928 RepID=UPI001F1FE842|nr:hypothetical protein [Thermus tengchongensis]
MAPLNLLVETLAQAQYQAIRGGQGVGFSPAPPPEHRPILVAWRDGLPHGLEEGERIPAKELLRLERLACTLLAAQGGLPPLTWATFYYLDRHEPERVLAPRENLLPHLRWRARNLPAARRVHLAATDASFLLDLEAPLEAFLQIEGSGLELYAWPEERLREYLQAAARGRAPQQATLEWRGQTYRGTWEELAQVVGAIRKVKLVI